MKTLSRALMMLCIFLTHMSCRCTARKSVTLSDYKQTVRSARAALPIAAQMEELFPLADHFITQFGFDSSPRMWNTEVFFGGRYTLTMQVNVEIDYSANKIKKVIGEPKFYLHEAEKIEILPDGRASKTLHSENERRFGPDEWKKFYESKGDLSVIGVKLNGSPLTNFDEAVSQTRRDRVPVSLLEK